MKICKIRKIKFKLKKTWKINWKLEEINWKIRRNEMKNLHN